MVAEAEHRVGTGRIFDLSIILNVHDETKYLARTLRSCEEAVRFAGAGGARSEIVIVLDRPAPAVVRFIDAYDFGAFDGCQIIVVDNGSLGPSRNDGIRHASGAYITTCDADDLISFNTFAEMLAVARAAGPLTILVPQYLVMFGAEYCIVEYFDSSVTTPLMFTAFQPYHSRLFAIEACLKTYHTGSRTQARGMCSRIGTSTVRRLLRAISSFPCRRRPCSAAGAGVACSRSRTRLPCCRFHQVYYSLLEPIST